MARADLLTIRDAQLDALQDSPRRRFLDAMVAHLRAHFADELRDVDDDALRANITRGLARAREHGLSGHADQARFLGLCAAFGWDFDRDERWAAEALADATYEPAERLRRVHGRYLRALERDVQNEKAREEFGLDD